MSPQRIALLLTQRRDSGNWDPAGYAAATAAAERHGFALEVVEEVSFERAEVVAEELASSGVQLIIGHGADYGPPLLDVARRHSDTRFGLFSYVVSTDDLPNVAGWTVSWNEVEFLCGAIAGLATRTGRIGTIRGVDLVPAEQALAFLGRGARYTRPDVELTVEEISSWYDLAGAAAATRRLAEQGVDVVYPAADSADAAVQATSAELGLLTFGEYVDEGARYPTSVITSFTVNEQRAYDELGEMLAGEWRPGIRQLDTAGGDIRFTTLRNVDEDVVRRFEETYEALRRGTFAIPA